MPIDRKINGQFGYVRSRDQDRDLPAHHPVIIVGAGPVGMTLALDLASRGLSPVLLDDADRIGVGSRGICWAKRTLEIWDRLGLAAPLIEKGVVWRKGRVFRGDRQLYDFDLLPDGGHKMPAFVNLQQYYVEQRLAQAILQRPAIDLRWRNRVTAIEQPTSGAAITIATPDGDYVLTCDWLICCDGARSPCREQLGLTFAGTTAADKFLIADIRMTAAFPTERWFWFDPPFHQGQSALLHKQPDDIWRVDLQLGRDADAEAERQPARVRPRIARMLGHAQFELEWLSVYTFQCRRLARFRQDRVVFAGDAAHQVSPFGARGANSGVQDADNLGWKLAAVIAGAAPERLLESYDIERGQAADESIRHSSGATDFIAPRSTAERTFRDAALDLAGHAGFAERFVNAGRLSTATAYETPLTTPDASNFTGLARLGAPLPDAPVLVVHQNQPPQTTWLLDLLDCTSATVLAWSSDAPDTPGMRTLRVGRDILDREGLLTFRLDARPGSVYLIRPDQHLAARSRTFDAGFIARAHDRMSGNAPSFTSPAETPA